MIWNNIMTVLTVGFIFLGVLVCIAPEIAEDLR